MGKGEDAARHPVIGGAAPCKKEYLAQNVRSAVAEKSCFEMPRGEQRDPASVMAYCFTSGYFTYL